MAYTQRMCQLSVRDNVRNAHTAGVPVNVKHFMYIVQKHSISSVRQTAICNAHKYMQTMHNCHMAQNHFQLSACIVI